MNRRSTDRYHRANNRLGWSFFVLAAAVVAWHLVNDRAFTTVVVTLITLLAFGGGALVQGVSLDRIVRAFRGRNGACPPRDSGEVAESQEPTDDPRRDQ